MQLIDELARWQLYPLTFGQSAVAASQTAAALYAQEVHGAVVLDNIGYTVPFEGYVVGISLNTTAASTDGTLTVVPTIDTTATTDPSLAITTAVVGADFCPRTTNYFAANSVIGADLTTTATWTAETMDLLVQVWVLVKIDSI